MIIFIDKGECMDNKEYIKEYCRNLKLDVVGFSRCRVYDELKDFFQSRKLLGQENEFEEKDIEKRINPFLQLPEAKTIISIAFPYYFGKAEKRNVYFSLYTLGRDYHFVITEYLKKICSLIEQMGYKAKYFTDNNPLPERYIARESGIGIIGKNYMLITKEYGSYVFLGEIITDMPVEDYDKPRDTRNIMCDNCNRCTIACPGSSIKTKDHNTCLSYITQKKDIEDAWFTKFNGRIFGCDTCQEVCPYNKEVKLSGLEDFTPLPHMQKADAAELLSINKSVFNEKYKITSAGWRGKNILQRNAMINVMKDINMRSIINPENIASPYIREYYGRLLKSYNL